MRVAESGPRPRPDLGPQRRSARRATGASLVNSGRITKHLFVTGGVASSLGKGLTASSLG